MLRGDVLDDIADEVDVDSDVITERDNGLDRHDISLVDILADRSRVTHVVTLHGHVSQLVG